MFAKVEELRDRLQRFGKRQFVAGPQSEEVVAEAERLLGTRLPPSYRAFLKIYGGGFGVSGIWRGDAAAVNPGTLWGDVQRVRRQYRVSDNLVPVFFLPLGGACCLDLSQPDERGECPVVQVMASHGTGELVAEPHSDTFAEFLVWHLEQLITAYEDAAG